MIRAVIDCNVLISGTGWRSEPYMCLVAVARRRVRAFHSLWIREECERVAKKIEADGTFQAAPWPMLAWYFDTARLVEPAPLGKQRSRDAKDDPYLAAALAARAQCVVTRDPDLLELEKPFGVEMLTPRALLHRLALRT